MDSLQKKTIGTVAVSIALIAAGFMGRAAYKPIIEGLNTYFTKATVASKKMVDNLGIEERADGPNAIAADVNEDGLDDIVVAGNISDHQGRDYFSGVLINNGDGTYTSWDGSGSDSEVIALVINAYDAQEELKR